MNWRGWIYIIASLISLKITLRLDATPCRETEYQVKDGCCPLCNRGERVKKDCEGFSTTCVACTEGTYTNKSNGLKKCHTCSTCDAASGLKVKQLCNLSADAVCEPLEGFLCTNLTSDNCSAARRHSSCKPGQYIKKTGTGLSDTECSDCSRGTFSDGTFPSCQPHTQCETLMKAGSASADAECAGKGSDAGTVFIVLLFILLFSVAIFFSILLVMNG